MLKRVLAIGVLLTIGLPVYGEQEGGKASGNQHNGDPAPNPQSLTIATASCVIKQDGTSIECHYPQADPPSYFSRLRSPENLPNLLLVLVGLGGVVAAGLTLRAINGQAAIMQRQMEVVINKERARIFVHRAPSDYSFLGEGYERPEDPYAGLGDPEIDKFHIVISNQGESKAYDVSCFCSVAVTSTVGHDLVRQQFEETIGIMEANAKPIRHGIEFFPCLSDKVLDSIRNETAKLRFNGWVRYENAFEPKRIIVPFGWIWVIQEEVIDTGDGCMPVDQSHWEEDATRQNPN